LLLFSGRRHVGLNDGADVPSAAKQSCWPAGRSRLIDRCRLASPEENTDTIGRAAGMIKWIMWALQAITRRFCGPGNGKMHVPAGFP
jgi:hypothetical protein